MQKNLFIKQTESSPEINLDANTGKLLIRGYSYPENANTFYEPVSKWIEEFLKNENKIKIEVHLNLPYINTSSIKFINYFLQKLEQSYLAGKEILINWYYNIEDEYELDTIKEFISDLEIR